MDNIQNRQQFTERKKKHRLLLWKNENFLFLTARYQGDDIIILTIPPVTFDRNARNDATYRYRFWNFFFFLVKKCLRYT